MVLKSKIEIKPCINSRKLFENQASWASDQTLCELSIQFLFFFIFHFFSRNLYGEARKINQTLCKWKYITPTSIKISLGRSLVQNLAKHMNYVSLVNMDQGKLYRLLINKGVDNFWKKLICQYQYMFSHYKILIF